MPKALYQTRRGLLLKGPSPYELKCEQIIRKPEPKKRKLKASHRSARRHYQLARTRLGLSPNAAGSLDWAQINRRTTFIWKFDTLLECAQWMIRECFAAMHRNPLHDRVKIATHYAQLAFGIMPSDIMSDQRSPVFVIARYLAMVCVRRSGIGRNDTARRFNRDQTVVKLAERKVAHYFEGIPYAGAEPHPSDLGPTSDGQSDGKLPS